MTALRSAVRAAPVSRPARGARSVQILDTEARGIAANGPCRSAVRVRNRAVFVSARAPRDVVADAGIARAGAAGVSGTAGVTGVAGAGSGARWPGATGHSRSTQARNPRNVDAG